MKLSDKVALILSQYGFSLAEGLKMYAQFEASEDRELVRIDSNKGYVVHLKEKSEESNDLFITVWLNYVSNFCLNYNLAGAVAMHDSELNFTEEDTTKFLEFFQSCHDAYRENQDEPELPELPDDMAWVFKHSILDDYMESTFHEVNEKTLIKIDWSESLE